MNTTTGIRVGVLLAAWVSALAPSLAAQPPGGAAPQASPSRVAAASPQLTASDLEAFLDGFVPIQLRRNDLAGAVVAIVKDGQVLVAKGYGFADVGRRTSMTSDATLVRPGSISKLFTWTSVMQLVEQGKLDLSEDVNRYLDFQIPPAFDKPITLKDIMSHSAGFEEVARDLFVDDAQHLMPLGTYVKQHVPRRIFPPGVVPAYSNYATTLAAYIVERVSGEPFQQYADRHIFAPLGMARTTFVQPLPDRLRALMSSGYVKASGPARPFELVAAYPAGSVSTTAADMCRFMIAHLQDGRFEQAEILRPDTAKLMHSRLFGPDERLNAMAYGFYEESRNGLRVIGHGGDTVLFHSDLHLIPEKQLGFFVSYNSAGRGLENARTTLFEAFLDRYYAFTPAAATRLPSAAADAEAVSGVYKTSRRAESSIVKLATLVEEVGVSSNGDGTITLDASFLRNPDGQAKRFEEIGPFLFREVHGQDLVGFRKDAGGRWQFQIDWPIFVFQRVGAAEHKYLNYAVLAFSLTVLVLTVGLWPVGGAVRRHYGRTLDLASADRWLRCVVRLVCLVGIVASVGPIVVLSLAADDPGAINALPGWIVGFGLLAVVFTLGTVVVCVNAVRSMRTRGRSAWVRLHDLAMALACAALVWFAYTWNFMVFNVHY